MSYACSPVATSTRDVFSMSGAVNLSNMVGAADIHPVAKSMYMYPEERQCRNRKQASYFPVGKVPCD